jgi:hypothetical protein
MRFFGPGKSQVLLIEWIHTLKSLDFIIELLHILNLSVNFFVVLEWTEI